MSAHSTRVRARTRRGGSAAALLTTLALIAPAASSATSWSANVKFPPGHDPKIGTKWTFNGTANRGHTPLSGQYRYTLYLKGTSLASRSRQSKWRSFKNGHFSHTLNLSTHARHNGHGISQAVGLSLAIKVQIKTTYGTRTFSDNFTLKPA